MLPCLPATHFICKSLRPYSLIADEVDHVPAEFYSERFIMETFQLSMVQFDVTYAWFRVRKYSDVSWQPRQSLQETQDSFTSNIVHWPAWNSLVKYKHAQYRTQVMNSAVSQQSPTPQLPPQHHPSVSTSDLPSSLQNLYVRHNQQIKLLIITSHWGWSCGYMDPTITQIFRNKNACCDHLNGKSLAQSKSILTQALSWWRNY